MDLDEQKSVKDTVDRVGAADTVVVLGSPSPESAELYAATVSLGDPTYAGPLAGIPLGLPVYHVLEDELAGQLPRDFYDEHLAMSALVLDTQGIFGAVRRIRDETAQAS